MTIGSKKINLFIPSPSAIGLLQKEKGGNWTKYQGVKKHLKFRFVISRYAVQIRPWAP
jgi:hypothetical protein